MHDDKLTELSGFLQMKMFNFERIGKEGKCNQTRSWNGVNSKEKVLKYVFGTAVW